MAKNTTDCESPKCQQYISLYQLPILCPHFFCNRVLMIHKFFSIMKSQRQASTYLHFSLSVFLKYKEQLLAPWMCTTTLSLPCSYLLLPIFCSVFSHFLRLDLFYEQCLHWDVLVIANRLIVLHVAEDSFLLYWTFYLNCSTPGDIVRYPSISDHICCTFMLFCVFFPFSFDVSWPPHFLNVSPGHGVIQPWYVFMHLNLDNVYLHENFFECGKKYSICVCNCV